MPRPTPRTAATLGFTLIALAGCEAAPSPGRGQLALAPAEPLRQLAFTAGAWPFAVREDAPWTGLAERTQPVPELGTPTGGFAIVAVAGDRPLRAEPVASVMRFTPGRAFTLNLPRGADFALLDGDATDGEATLQLPEAVTTACLARPAIPGVSALVAGAKAPSLTITDPIHFRRQTLDRHALLAPWRDLGARPAHFPWQALLGPDRLTFRADHLDGFGLRWWRGGEAVPPPLPPLLTRLDGPDTRPAGESAEVTAVPLAGAALPADTRLRWTVTDPDWRAGPETATATPALGWHAPEAPGRYRVGATAETAYFRAIAPTPHPIEVYREVFLDSFQPPGAVEPDAARAIVADSWALPAGRRFVWHATGTMNPWGVTAGDWCGRPEATPLYPSPDRPAGTVALDPAYFFAMVAWAPCQTFAPSPVRLLGVSVDSGRTWVAPAPVPAMYQPAHRYAYPALVGAGAPVQWRVFDSRVWDNFGRFSLQLRRLD